MSIQREREKNKKAFSHEAFLIVETIHIIVLASAPIHHQEFGNVYDQWTNPKNNRYCWFQWQYTGKVVWLICPSGKNWLKTKDLLHHMGEHKECTRKSGSLCFLKWWFRCTLQSAFICVKTCWWDSWSIICPAKVSQFSPTCYMEWLMMLEVILRSPRTMSTFQQNSIRTKTILANLNHSIMVSILGCLKQSRC